MRRRKPEAVPGKGLAQELEEKANRLVRESKRLLALRRAHPELEIIEVSREVRLAVQEIQETAEADMLEIFPAEARARFQKVQEAAQAEIQQIAEANADQFGIMGQGYTFQVSEGVFTRPKKERLPVKPGRRKP
jgi:hypothetical protein